METLAHDGLVPDFDDFVKAFGSMSVPVGIRAPEDLCENADLVPVPGPDKLTGDAAEVLGIGLSGEFRL